MKLLITCVFVFSGNVLFAQATKPKMPVKPVVIEHELKAMKKTSAGFELSIVSGMLWNDDSIRTVEICFPDSSITFAKILYPEYKTFKKGELVKNLFYVVGDSIALKSKVASVGSFKQMYPKTESCKAEASIAFQIEIDSIPGQEWMLPDVVLQEGQIAVGDTINMVDNLGKKCTAKVVYLDIANKELNSTIVVPFVRKEFYTNEGDTRGVLYYSVLTGDQGMHESIKITID